MQPLARDGLSADVARALLTADDIDFSGGLDLLDTTGAFVADISDDLNSGSVARDCYAAVHGTCSLKITRELAWGKDRVRPYMTATGNGATVRFDLGVYVLTTPDTKRGEDPISYDVTGYDVLHLLQDGPGDTYEVTSGTTYLQAIRNVATASGVGATVLLDGTRGATALPATRVWALTGQGPSWLDIINDLLREIAYDPIWADWDGVLRSGPFADPSVRPVDWTFDTSDTATNIVGEDRTETQDVWSAPNWWKFVRSRMVDASGNSVQPVDGDGIYFPAVNADPAHPENTLLGRIVRKVEFLDAADQATLEAQGDKIVSQDLQVSHTWDLQIDPLPALWHRDVVTFIDGGTSNKVPVDSWTLNLDGSPGALNLGLAKDAAPDPVDSQAQATITQAAPLRAVVDGATTDSFVNALDAATYAVGQRVTVILRSPLPPLIQGTES